MINCILSYLAVAVIGAWIMYLYMRGHYHKDVTPRIKKRKTCNGCIYNWEDCECPETCEKDENGYYTRYRGSLE